MVLRYEIIATDGTGQQVHCFTWRGSPGAGIERAKVDAVKFDRRDLHDFEAVPLLPAERL